MSAKRPHRTRAPHRRPSVASCVGAAVVALLLAVVTSAGPSLSEASAPGLPSARPGAPAGQPSIPRNSVGAEPGPDVLAGPLDWGDPAIVASGSSFYLYSTQPLPWVNVPVEIGGSGGTWGPVEDALPALPPWAQSGATWSPEVHQFGDHWVLYFAAQIRGTDPAVHCIGDAVSGAPTGPFLAAAAPFICQQSLGGSIDPRVYDRPVRNPRTWSGNPTTTPIRRSTACPSSGSSG